MNNELYEIEYARWGKIVIKSQLIITSIVCLIEILNNFLLYLTRAQGYGPDTIVENLVRYLFLTSAINFGLVWLRQYRIMGQSPQLPLCGVALNLWAGVKNGLIELYMP